MHVFTHTFYTNYHSIVVSRRKLLNWSLRLNSWSKRELWLTNFILLLLYSKIHAWLANVCVSSVPFYVMRSSVRLTLTVRIPRQPVSQAKDWVGMVRVEYLLTKYSSIGEWALKLPEQSYSLQGQLSITRLHPLALSIPSGLRAPLGKRVESYMETANWPVQN